MCIKCTHGLSRSLREKPFMEACKQEGEKERTKKRKKKKEREESMVRFLTRSAPNCPAKLWITMIGNGTAFFWSHQIGLAVASAANSAKQKKTMHFCKTNVFFGQRCDYSFFMYVRPVPGSSWFSVVGSCAHCQMLTFCLQRQRFSCGICSK